MEVNQPRHSTAQLEDTPDGWFVKPLGSLGQWFSGSTPSMRTDAYWGGDTPWVSPKDMKVARLYDAIDHITAKAVTDGARLLPVGSIVMVIRGMILAHSFPVARVERPLAFNQDIKALVVGKDISSGFVLYWLISNANALRQLTTDSTHGTKRLPPETLYRVPVRLPKTLEEQTAIAGALSDADGLIGALDRLIAKKRYLKQAAMQQLLTGRARLPGFKGKWKLTRLGGHVSYLSHATHARAVLLSEGSVRYLHYGDVHAAPSIWLDPRTTPMPFVPERLAARFDRLESGDLVFVDASEDLTGIGKSVELRGVEGMEIIAGLHTITARFDKSVLADGFKGYLQFMPPFKTQLQRLAAGTKVYASNKSHVSSVEIELPGVDEQAAIADALNNMAAEIAGLEARRDKTKLLKTGMMQELLTGRTRLVKPEGVAC